jgi:hypothetical protein
VSDTPREQEPDDTQAARASRFGMGEPTAGARDTEAIEPTTGPPAGSGGALPAAAWTSGGGARGAAGAADAADAAGAAGAADAAGAAGATGTGGEGSAADAAGPAGATGGSGAAGSSRRVTLAGEPDPESEAGRRQRRRRRLFVTGIAVAAALIVIALCAGVLGVISAVSGFRDQAADARESRRLRETSCLELEQRLNRLTPPGATGNPPARAIAIRDENAAVRIYVEQAPSERDQNAWRQLLDARTAYAEALVQQAKTRTPAFFVDPRAEDGSAVTDQLARWSPAACAGAIRRLAAPDW